MKQQLIKLITVKTIITVACLAIMIYSVINGIVDGDFIKTIITMVFSFYFGTQYQKNAAAADQAAEDPEEVK